MQSSVSVFASGFQPLISFSKGRFLYNNYKQALSIIAEFTPEVNAFKEKHSLPDDVFEVWRNQELEYLMSLSAAPEYDVQAIAYVEALEALGKAQ